MMLKGTYLNPHLVKLQNITVVVDLTNPPGITADHTLVAVSCSGSFSAFSKQSVSSVGT